MARTALAEMRAVPGRHGATLVTFDAGIAALDGGDGVVVLVR